MRGEIFFARRWLLVEGLTEYLLVHALGEALQWPLDDHGVAVIDFKQSGNAGIYPALADAFAIPWHMIVDGDVEGKKSRREIMKRGFEDDDLVRRFDSLPLGNTLESQLISDGHEQLLREILAESGNRLALTCPLDELRTILKNNKSGYMRALSLRVAKDFALARQMPTQFVSLVSSLREGTHDSAV